MASVVDSRRSDEAGTPELAQATGTGRPGLSPRTILRLQRSLGNAAVAGVLRGAIQRDDPPPVPVTGVGLSASKATVPGEAGLNLKASAKPGTATGVKFSVEKGTVSPTGVTIDATSGAITLGAGQEGGSVTVKATADDGSWASSDLRVIEKPTAVASTTASSAGGSVYGGQFSTRSARHLASRRGSRARTSTRSSTSTAQTPFGPFSLAANAAGSHGWDLDASGTMAGPDNVDIDKSKINIGRFVRAHPTRARPPRCPLASRWCSTCTRSRCPPAHRTRRHLPTSTTCGR